MGGSERVVCSNATPGRRFTLVLAGGGARGYAHVGVLKGLEDEGIRPNGLVGVSMGAVVASAYSLLEDWYEALMNIDTSGFPRPHYGEVDQKVPFVRQVADYAHTAWSMVRGWGAPPSVVEAGRAVLSDSMPVRSASISA